MEASTIIVSINVKDIDIKSDLHKLIDKLKDLEIDILAFKGLDKHIHDTLNIIQKNCIINDMKWAIYYNETLRDLKLEQYNFSTIIVEEQYVNINFINRYIEKELIITLNLDEISNKKLILLKDSNVEFSLMIGNIKNQKICLDARLLKKLKKQISGIDNGTIGFSNKQSNFLSSVIAASLGASVIEKEFNLYGSINKVNACFIKEFNQLKKMVKYLKIIPKVLPDN